MGSSGTTAVFGNSGDTITFATADTVGTAAFVAGSGNETLNGGYARFGLSFFGGTSNAASVTSGINDVLTGGAGNDTLVSGAGNETLAGGSGNNLFVINATTDGVGAHITIADFGAAAGNLLAFAHYTTAEIQSALNGAQTVTGAGGEVNTVITLSDDTQVTFIGVSTLSGHTVI